MSDKYYTYKNFDMDINGSALPIIVWGIWAGVLLGVLAALVCRSCTGGLVHRLKKAGASDKSCAKTLGELGIKHKWLTILMLGENSSMHRYIKIANESEISRTYSGKLARIWFENIAGQPLRLAEARFYLPEESRIEAETRYTHEKNPIRSFVLAAIVLTGAALFAAYAIPELLVMVDNFITSVQPDSNIL